MYRVASFIILFIVIHPCGARAGAWLRDKGTGFLSSSASIAQDEDSASIYIEYGVTAETTLGTDLNIRQKPDLLPEGHAEIFLRRAWGATDHQDRFSWQAGIGAQADQIAYYPSLSVGASWGRAIEVNGKYGWATVDALTRWSFEGSDRTLKLDGTIGLGLSERYKVMGQLFLSHQRSALTVKLAPSLLVQFPNAKTTIQIGFESEFGSLGDSALKIGLWRDF